MKSLPLAKELVDAEVELLESKLPGSHVMVIVLLPTEYDSGSNLRAAIGHNLAEAERLPAGLRYLADAVERQSRGEPPMTMRDLNIRGHR